MQRDSIWITELLRYAQTNPAAFATQLLLMLLASLLLHFALAFLTKRWSGSYLRSIDERELWDDERKEAERARIHVLERYLLNTSKALAVLLFIGSFGIAYSVPIIREMALSARAWFVAGGFAALVSIAIVVVAASIGLRLIRKTAKALVPTGGKSLEREVARASTIRSVIESTAQIAIGTMVILFALSVLGAPVGSLIAGVGILGLAISFGAQSLVKDVISGFFILMEDQYGVGDVIQIAGLSGLVEAVNLRITKLRDVEGRVHIIPNGQVDKATIMTRDWSRSVLDLDVAYRTDLEHALEVLKEEAEAFCDDTEWAWRFVDKPDVLGVERFGDSGITLRLMFKTLPREQWTVGREFRKRIKRRFDTEGIEIPFPHVTFYWGEGQAMHANRLDVPQEALPERP